MTLVPQVYLHRPAARAQCELLVGWSTGGTPLYSNFDAGRLVSAESEAAWWCIACAASTGDLATVQGHLRNLGVQMPTPVQEAAIPRVLRGENIAIQSYTGSGKVRQPPGSSF